MPHLISRLFKWLYFLAQSGWEIGKSEVARAVGPAMILATDNARGQMKLINQRLMLIWCNTIRATDTSCLPVSQIDYFTCFKANVGQADDESIGLPSHIHPIVFHLLNFPLFGPQTITLVFYLCLFYICNRILLTTNT